MEISEPTKPTEFEIQAWLWNSLTMMGFNIRGEVVAQFQDGGYKRQKCRFDLVHFEDGKPLGIIEVKPSRTKHKSENGWVDTRQGRRYHCYKLPVKIVYGMADAIDLAEHASVTGRLWEPASDQR